MVVRTSPDASFFIVTFAFGTTAPAASEIVALSVPVNCWPKQGEANRMRASSKAAALAVFLNAESTRVEFITPPRISVEPGWLLLTTHPLRPHCLRAARHNSSVFILLFETTQVTALPTELSREKTIF